MTPKLIERVEAELQPWERIKSSYCSLSVTDTKELLALYKTLAAGLDVVVESGSHAQDLLEFKITHRAAEEAGL